MIMGVGVGVIAAAACGTRRPARSAQGGHARWLAVGDAHHALAHMHSPKKR